jgi:DNA polymerase-3 subunit delta
MLAAKESPAGILAGLAWCFRKLIGYLALCESSAHDSGGGPNSFELKKIGLSSPKAKTDYENAARRYRTEAAVNACLALTAEYDILTRASGTAFETVLMDVYLLKIMALC